MTPITHIIKFTNNLSKSIFRSNNIKNKIYWNKAKKKQKNVILYRVWSFLEIKEDRKSDRSVPPEFVNP